MCSVCVDLKAGLRSHTVKHAVWLLVIFGKTKVCEDRMDSGGNVSGMGSRCKTVYISIDFDTVSQNKVLELFS